MRLGVWKRPGVPNPLSLSLSESGVEADSDEREGRDIEIDFAERSRTFTIGPCVGIGELV